MKAIQIKEFGGPEVLKVAEIEEPTPNEGEVKVKLYAVGINPSDSYTITGTYGNRIPELPYVPGSDGAGIIEEVGGNVENVEVGDRVHLSAIAANRNTGTYAEKIVLDAKNVHPLPDYMSFNEGAALGIPVFTAYRALHQKAQIKAGETVMIHGASGAVGTMVLQMAKAVGAIVIGTSSTEAGRANIIELGADYAIPHVTAENKEALLEITNQQGPDVIIEFLANINLETDTQVIADYGRIVVVGSRGEIKMNPRNLMTNEATVTGMIVSSPNNESLHGIYHGVNALVNSKLLKPVLDRKFTLDEGPAAHTYLMESSGNGRTIFEIEEEK